MRRTGQLIGIFSSRKLNRQWLDVCTDHDWPEEYYSMPLLSGRKVDPGNKEAVKGVARWLVGKAISLFDSSRESLNVFS
jgi:hypothetical protein